MTYGLGLFFVGLLVGLVSISYNIGRSRKEKEMVKNYADKVQKDAVKANKAKSSVSKSVDLSTSSVRKKYTRK